MKSPNKKALIFTTINHPTAAIKQFSRLTEFVLFIAGDKKTPKDWASENCELISLAEQKQKYPSLASYISENHYARKNFAYLESIKSGTKYIYESDDDNYPLSIFPNFITKKTNLVEIKAGLTFNVHSLFTKEKVWPRGLPLNYINETKVSKSRRLVMPYLQQSLVDRDPDVDAMYRLTVGKNVIFDTNKSYLIAKETFCPVNSQNTFWHKNIFPLLYLPSSVTSRTSDIWRGYIAQRILWEIGSLLLYLSPSVYQKRNPHDYMDDLKEEADVMLKVQNILSVLSEINLNGGIDTMLIKIYTKLVNQDLLKKSDLKALGIWLKLF